MQLDYRILGPIEVWSNGRRLDIGASRLQRLIGALVLADGRPVTAERLVDVVWDGDPPDQARNTLRTYVARVRRALEVDGWAPLLTDANGWRLDRTAEELDSARFESLLDAARSLGADPLAALGCLEECLSLWRGEAFAGFEHEAWCAAEAVRLEELHVSALEERVEAMLGCGLFDDAIAELERLTGRYPVRDRLRGQHMLALYRAGRQVEAVRVFQNYRRFLTHEVGVDPSPELTSLEHRIVSRDPALRPTPPAGRTLRGYQLGPEIGAGAFGRVFRAAQPVLGREVAIKVIRADLADDADFIRRFDAEARMIARLEHPHIVPLFDYWREPGGAYLVMRYLRGGSASDLLAAEGALPLERVIRVVEEIGGALATAHAAGVVHHDVKPGNIVFDEQGAAYLGDFGVASGIGTRQQRGAPASSTGSVYASPEHLAAGVADPRDDVYAFGTVLWELLAGRSPFPDDTPAEELIHRKRLGELPSLTEIRPELPGVLDEVIRRATAPDLDSRYADVTELVLEVRSAIGRAQVQPAPLGMATRNPYKGLAAFGETDAVDFFGRGALVDRLLAHISAYPFLAVVGPSGSGKSSLARAGLTPRLRAGGAFVVTMIPGQRPLQELSRALLDIASIDDADDVRALTHSSDPALADVVMRCVSTTGADVVLIIDQFEELYTVADSGERERFLAAIASAVADDSSRLRVIATLRADIYDRPLDDPTIGELMQANSIAVTSLGPAELDVAITEPAARVGVTVERALVDALIADAAGAPATLPLVEYELTHLFDRRRSDALTAKSYRDDGGLGGAIARRADDVYDALTSEQRDESRRMFARLVAPLDDSEAVRRRVRRTELSMVSDPVIEAFGRERLLTFDRDPSTREPSVEIAHEALIRGWPRLGRWVDDGRAGLRTLSHLTAAAAEWEATNRDPSGLYRGNRLNAAEEWTTEHPGELNPIEQAFLGASIDARDAASAHERRRVRRLRGLVATVSVVAIVAAAAGLVALRQRSSANEHAAEAELRASENYIARLISDAAVARADDDPDLAILLALTAYDAASALGDPQQPGVIGALHESVQASRLERVLPSGNLWAGVSPDGRRVALDDPTSRRLSVHDLDSGELIRARDVPRAIGGIEYNADGSLIAVAQLSIAAGEPAVLLVDASSLETVDELTGGFGARLPTWSADGGSVAVFGDQSASPRVWRTNAPDDPRTVAEPGTPAAFVPGTDELAVLSDGLLTITDHNTGEILSTHEAPDDAFNVKFSADGNTVAYQRSGSMVTVAGLDGDETPVDVSAPSARSIRLSPDGSTLTIAGNSSGVRVLDLRSGEEFTLNGHGEGVDEQEWTPAGDRLVVPLLEGGTRVWSMASSGPASLGNIPVDGQVVSAAGAPDGRVLLATQTASNRAAVDEIATTGERRRIAEFLFETWHRPVFSPDGTLTAGFVGNELVPTAIEVATGDIVTTLHPCETPRAIDALNRWVLVESSCPESFDGERTTVPRTGFVDLDTGDLLAAGNAGNGVAAAALGPPGSVAADLVAYHSGPGGTVVFQRASDLEVLATWNIPSEVIALTISFSPDGRSVGIGAQSREGIVLDVDAVLSGTPADEAVTVHEELHPGPVIHVIPMGDQILSSGVGPTYRLWDAESGAQLAHLAADSSANPFLFAPAGGSAAFYQDADGVLRRVLTDPAELAHLARERVHRDFSQAECERFLSGERCAAR